ncbi:MAG: hypothetical protein LBM95_00570 [Lactobacillales bacterium]|jgi:hypothetical protein|nr:hypothetical protein [Lactobacillales bacterium]
MKKSEVKAEILSYLQENYEGTLSDKQIEELLTLALQIEHVTQAQELRLIRVSLLGIIGMINSDNFSKKETSLQIEGVISELEMLIKKSENEENIVK